MRWTIYVDMDAFYVACELRDRPELRGQPVIVGPKPEGPESRGVVLSASYEARPFGIRSALPATTAMRLCPEAVWIPPNFSKYQKAAHEIRRLLERHSEQVIPFSIDEAALRVDAVDGSEIRSVAERIQSDLKESLGFSASIGASPWRVVAKIASDRFKPGGLTVVEPGEVAAFLAPLPLRVIPGIGPKTELRLRELGYERIGDLARVPRSRLRMQLGSWADELANLSRGTPVEAPLEYSPVPRSRSVDRTFERDTDSVEALQTTLDEMARELGTALQEERLKYQTITVRARWENFRLGQRSRTLAAATDDVAPLRAEARRLLRDLLDQERRGEHRRVRTLALAAGSLAPVRGRVRPLEAFGSERSALLKPEAPLRD